MGMMDRLKAFVGMPTQQARFIGTSRAYEGGRRDLPQFGSWDTRISHPDEEVIGSRDQVVARARDLVRNHPVISGGIDRRVEAVVGPDIRLEAQPNYEAMGRDADWADKWAGPVEAKWSAYVNDDRCYVDAERHSPLGGLVETAYRHYQHDGEALAIIKMKKRGGKFGTFLQIIDPDRLCNPTSIPEGQTLANGNRVFGGVEVDADGAPVAYYIRNKHPNDLNTMDTWKWTRVRRELGNGRRVVIHAFKKNRAEQRRGVSRLAAALKQIRMSDRYDNAELEAAILNAMLAISIESPYPTADVVAAMAPITDANDAEGMVEKLVSYREQNKLNIPNAIIRHTLPGEQAKVLTAEHPSGDYPSFQAAMLRKIAGALGLTYEQLSQDWSTINYSSARTLLNEIWRGLLHDRVVFTRMFCTPFYAAWLEEAVLIGEVKVPGGYQGFYKWRAELCQCEWMGPGRGTIDPKKESDANESDLRMNSTTLADIAADQGKDPKKIAQRRAREKKMLEELGLTDISDQEKLNQVGRPAEGATAEDGGDNRSTDGKFAPTAKKKAPADQGDNEE